MTTILRKTIESHILNLKLGVVIREVRDRHDCTYCWTDVFQRVGYRIGPQLLRLEVKDTYVALIRQTKRAPAIEISNSDPELLARIERELTYAINFIEYMKDNKLRSSYDI